MPRFPTLFLAFTLLLLGSLAWTAGLILDGIRRSRHEAARLMYLRYSAVGAHGSAEDAQRRRDALGEQGFAAERVGRVG